MEASLPAGALRCVSPLPHDVGSWGPKSVRLAPDPRGDTGNAARCRPRVGEQRRQNSAWWDAWRGRDMMVGPLVWVAASGPVGTPPASSCPPPFSASARPRARCPLFQGRAFAEQQIHRLCFSRGAMPRLVSEGKNLGDFRAHCVVCVVCPHCATFDQRTGSSGCDNIADLQEMEDARCPQSIVIGC